VYRPEPIPLSSPGSLSPSITDIDRSNDWNASARALIGGQQLLVRDLYSTAIGTLGALRRQLEMQHPQADQDHGRSRELRAAYHRASQNLLAPISSHRLALDKAPDIGWFKELYQDISDFLLPFPLVQGLNSSWQWSQRGIEIPVLARRLFPFYGTYFPTRFDHIELFDTWLQKYAGPRDLACDIGTGCGVLALLLAQAGFGRVLATDSNANAVESVRRELKRQPVQGEIEVREADLFGDWQECPDLIVFNPPWLQGPIHTPMDEAIYHDGALFDRFFRHAHARLTGDGNPDFANGDDGRLVLLFSNLPQMIDAGALHPIQQELDAGGRFDLIGQDRQLVRTASAKTRRRKRDPAAEYVELWELAPRPVARTHLHERTSRRAR